MSDTPTGFAQVKTAHQDLRSEQGALRGEHPGRSGNPVIKVADLAWLEFEKPDPLRQAHVCGARHGSHHTGGIRSLSLTVYVSTG